MPKNRKIQPFFLFLVDDDKRNFNIVGPISDDTDWTNKIYELQEAGRKVRCFNASIDKSKEIHAESYSEEKDYTFSRDLIFDEPEDSSLKIRGSLPDYAKSADRKKLVIISCKGECNTDRFAEMNVNYPGEKILGKSNLGDFTATCLKCGRIAEDSYNWYR